MPSRQEVEEAVHNSIEALFDEGRKLLIDNANERCISHRLAMHLEQEFSPFEIDYAVEVEYNRITAENGAPDDIKKRVL